MAGETTSAVTALNSLRVQIEDRLMQTEDYRALRAIERAIADVLSPTSAKFANLSSILNAMVFQQPSPAAPPHQKSA